MSYKTRVTVESLLQDLSDDRQLARSLGQASAAIQATQLAAKLVGLLIDRKESGQPGEFSNLQTPDEIVAAVRSDLGDAIADALALVLSKQPEPAAEQAPLAPEISAKPASDAVN